MNNNAERRLNNIRNRQRRSETFDIVNLVLVFGAAAIGAFTLLVLLSIKLGWTDLCRIQQTLF